MNNFFSVLIPPLKDMLMQKSKKLQQVTKILVFLAMSVMLWNCKEKDDEEQSRIVVENSDALTQNLFADQTDAESVVFFTTGAWTSTITEGVNSWINFDPEKGDVSGRYTISIHPTTNTTGIDRTAVFTIRCSGEKCDITIKQKATDINGNPYDPDEIEESIEYFKRDWELLQNARIQALAEDREPLFAPAIQKILFVACTNTSLGGTLHVMDDLQKQFFKDVVKNFKEVVELWSNHNVIIETDILFIERNVVIPDENPTYLTQASIQAELNVHAPVCAYDGILVTAASSMPGSVYLGAKTAGYENLYGYAWFKLVIPTGSAVPPTSYSYVMPKADEAPFLSTHVAIHEWLHQLEFLGNLLNYSFPDVHSSAGPPEFPEYVKYTVDPVWDFAAFYRNLIQGKIQYTSEGKTRNIGMFPLMWHITPRFLYSNAIYIINEANGLYLTYSDNITGYSSTPFPWYIRYNSDDKYMIYSPEGRCLDISNAWNLEGNAVNIHYVNVAYPQAQNFRISQNKDGTYKITTTFESNNRALQRNTGSTHPTGTTINADNGSADQKWRIINKP